MKTYFAIVHHDAGSAFGLTFPDLPGCFAAADEEGDLYEAARTALALYAVDIDELPAPRTIEQLINDADTASELKKGAALVGIPLIVPEHKHRVNVMFDSALLKGIDETARIAGQNRSEFLASVARSELTRRAGAVVAGSGKSEGKGKNVASADSKVLRSKSVSKAEKSVVASALTQKGSNEKTNARVASAASKVLRSKPVAASALTHKTKKSVR